MDSQAVDVHSSGTKYAERSCNPPRAILMDAMKVDPGLMSEPTRPSKGKEVIRADETAGPSRLDEEKPDEMNDECPSKALPDDIAGSNVKNVKDLKPEDPAKEATNFRSQISNTNYHGNIGDGYAPVMNSNTSQIVVKGVNIATKIFCLSGKELEKESKFLMNGVADMVKIPSGKQLVALISKCILLSFIYFLFNIMKKAFNF